MFLVTCTEAVSNVYRASSKTTVTQDEVFYENSHDL